MLKLGSRALSQTPLFSSFETKPTSQFKWKVKLFHKDGGIKKDWVIGQSSCPISSLQFELNKKLCGAGSIEFSFLDFPVDGGDFIEVFFDGSIKYRAKIESSVDPKGGTAKLIPYSIRLQELLVNNSFASKTISEMLQTIIEAVQDDTNISWNSFYVDTGETDTYTLDYSNYETPKKIIDELVGKLDDREWGVNANNIFVVYQPETTVTKYLLNTYTPYFSSLDSKKEYTKIKATRYQVFKKGSGTAELSRIGQVGYGSGYPVLDIEDELGESRVDKFIVSEYINDDNEALDIAYGDLKAKANVPQITNVKDVNLDYFFPTIGQKIKIQDKIEYIRRTIINCDALNNDDNTMINGGVWNNATLDSVNYVTNAQSVKRSVITAYDDIFYDLGKITKFTNAVKIGFMIRSSQATDKLEWSTGDSIAGSWGIGTWSSGTWSSVSSGADNLWNTVTPLNILNGGLWYYMQFNVLSTDFRYFGIRLNTTLTAAIDINIDRIDLYIPDQPTFEENIVKATIDIKRGGYNCNMTLNDYDIFANDDDFINKKRLEKIESVQGA